MTGHMETDMLPRGGRARFSRGGRAEGLPA
jgi:hypothetical protein